MNRRVWTQSTRRSLLTLVAVTWVMVAGEGPAHVWSAAAAFPVTIRVDAGVCRGPLRPIWRFFGADEPNYAYTERRADASLELGQLAPRQRLFPHAQPADLRRWHSGPQVGKHQRVHGGRAGQAVYDWTIVDRIFDAYLQRGVRPYVADRVHAAGAIHAIRRPISIRWTPMAKYDEIFTGWAHPPKDYVGGAISCTRGSRTASSDMGARKSRRGTGRYGTSRISAIGKARPRSSTSCTTTRSTACGARCRPPGSAVRTPPAHGGPSWRVSRARPARHQLRHRRHRHAARLRVLPCEGRADVRERPRADGHRRSARHDRRGLSRSSPHIPSSSASRS